MSADPTPIRSVHVDRYRINWGGDDGDDFLLDGPTMTPPGSYDGGEWSDGSYSVTSPVHAFGECPPKPDWKLSRKTKPPGLAADDESWIFDD